MMCQRIGRPPISTIGFGRDVGLLGEAGAEAAGEDHDLHEPTSPRVAGLEASSAEHGQEEQDGAGGSGTADGHVSVILRQNAPRRPNTAGSVMRPR